MRRILAKAPLPPLKKKAKKPSPLGNFAAAAGGAVAPAAAAAAAKKAPAPPSTSRRAASGPVVPDPGGGAAAAAAAAGTTASRGIRKVSVLDASGARRSLAFKTVSGEPMVLRLQWTALGFFGGASENDMKRVVKREGAALKVSWRQTGGPPERSRIALHQHTFTAAFAPSRHVADVGAGLLDTLLALILPCSRGG